jgi:hypothetical protein
MCSLNPGDGVIMTHQPSYSLDEEQQNSTSGYSVELANHLRNDPPCELFANDIDERENYITKYDLHPMDQEAMVDIYSTIVPAVVFNSHKRLEVNAAMVNSKSLEGVLLHELQTELRRKRIQGVERERRLDGDGIYGKWTEVALAVDGKVDVSAEEIVDGVLNQPEVKVVNDGRCDDHLMRETGVLLSELMEKLKKESIPEPCFGDSSDSDVEY